MLKYFVSKAPQGWRSRVSRKSFFFWKDNIKTDLKYVECENVDLSHVARDVVHWHYFCVHGIETTRCCFFFWLDDYQLLRKRSAPRYCLQV